MWATRRAPAGGGARDGDDIVPEPRPSLLYLFNCRIDAPMDGSCLRWCVLHALLLMSPRDRAQLPAHAQLFLNQVLACPSRPAQMTMLCRLCVRSAMNKIDCKIVLEEYVLLHQAYENQEFKRLLPILEQHTCVHTHDAELRRQALLNQATAITSRHLSQPLQVSKWNKETQALLATVGVRQGRAAQKRRKVESECGGLVLDFAWLQPAYHKLRGMGANKYPPSTSSV